MSRLPGPAGRARKNPAERPADRSDSGAGTEKRPKNGAGPCPCDLPWNFGPGSDNRSPAPGQPPTADFLAAGRGPGGVSTAGGRPVIPTPMPTLADLKAVYDLPLPELMWRAAAVHREHHDYRDVQRCALLSIKTGGCPEDCGYCSQSARYPTAVGATPLLSVDEVKRR